MLQIKDIQSAVRRRGREYGAEKIYLFGSYARRDALKHSDVDLRIDRGNIKSGLALVGLLCNLEDDLGVPIDLVTTESLSDEFLAEIKQDEILLYEDSLL